MKKFLVLAGLSLFMTGCATPKFSFGYDFLNKRFTVSVEPQMRDGKSVVATAK